ncbi:MAG: hypothetical protein ACI9GW_002765 [Halieaceae bacterium]|jgi:hypothetical protein
MLSIEENNIIRDGCSSVVSDYLDDVVDENDQPTLVYRSGEREVIPAGSRVINCTGSLLRGEQEYETLNKKNNRAWVFSSQVQLIYNLLVIMNEVPAKVMNDCGLDFDR